MRRGEKQNTEKEEQECQESYKLCFFAYTREGKFLVEDSCWRRRCVSVSGASDVCVYPRKGVRV